jgi:hypothetical protein
MGRFLDELRSRPLCEFIGGPLDGHRLPIDTEQHPDTVRMTYKPAAGPAVVDVYRRDPAGDTFRFQRREGGTPDGSNTGNCGCQ